MDVTYLRAFLQTNNYELSKSFYYEIGFQVEYVTDELTLLKNGEGSFFLEHVTYQEVAKNFFLQICVSDINSAYELCLKAKYKSDISQILEELWGHVFYVWGPTGELLHVSRLSY